MIHMVEKGIDLINDHDYLFFITKGWIGNQIAANFIEFVKKDFKVYKPEEILSKFKTLEKEFKKMPLIDLCFYNQEILRYISSNNLKMTDTINKNLFLYVSTIPSEIVAGFWVDFSGKCPEQAKVFYSSNEKVDTYIKDVFKKDKSL